MNKAQMVALKHTLWAKIKRLGGFWREDEDTLKEFAIEAYDANKEALEEAIASFSKLLDQAKKIGKREHHG